jgi:hypothetical protein
LQAGVAATAHLVHGLDVTFAVAALFGVAAFVMVGFLVHLRPAGADEKAPVAREAADEVELVDGEGFGWSDPELVA